MARAVGVVRQWAGGSARGAGVDARGEWRAPMGLGVEVGGSLGGIESASA